MDAFEWQKPFVHGSSFINLITMIGTGESHWILCYSDIKLFPKGKKRTIFLFAQHVYHKMYIMVLNPGSALSSLITVLFTAFLARTFLLSYTKVCTVYLKLCITNIVSF